ncbi:hypothetical protein [Agrobacterium tumefaciens]|uniref:Uncharacterized protein n=1 Tax=Agrobacterium tumefaciens TaxID=358 RepID=A0A2L2LHB1_AGRTU|nr:hypothetical protein [Agrobacterium tumefaciens]AVH43721.1 hypothetical protein At1D1609_36680 [Agrobacterium tumefaciens]NSY97661.1 hypothetical protein [Agrobacterium tumefaciens]
MSGPGGPNNTDNDDKEWRPTSSIDRSGESAGQGNGNGAPNPCMFTEVTILASPNSAVTSTFVVGSILTIGISGPRVVAMSGGNIAGSITSARLADIIQCIAARQQYMARVTDINGGAVTVEVYPL